MLLFYLFLSIGVSFLCSLFEAVILSVSPAYAASLAESGTRTGQLLQKLKTKIDDSLAAILTLNTIAHTIGAAGVGAEVLRLYGDAYVAIASVILTILILVLSEIIPKTLGATYYRLLAPYTAYGIQFFIFITYPFVMAFHSLAKALGAKAHTGLITRDELVHTAEIGQKEGNLSEDEVAIIKNLLRLKKILVRDVMTPRTVVFALEQNSTVGEVTSEHESLEFSRIPIYEKEIDRITGMVNRYELVRAQAEGNSDLKISELAKPIHTIPDLVSIARAFDIFIKSKDHILLVVDEHGGIDGVITLEDVIETLLGVEITDEFDSVSDMREYAAKQWMKRKAAQERDK